MTIYFGVTQPMKESLFLQHWSNIPSTQPPASNRIAIVAGNGLEDWIDSVSGGFIQMTHTKIITKLIVNTRTYVGKIRTFSYIISAETNISFCINYNTYYTKPANATTTILFTKPTYL
jgi:hypothetical protein